MNFTHRLSATHQVDASQAQGHSMLLNWRRVNVLHQFDVLGNIWRNLAFQFCESGQNRDFVSTRSRTLHRDVVINEPVLHGFGVGLAKQNLFFLCLVDRASRASSPVRSAVAVDHVPKELGIIGGLS